MTAGILINKNGKVLVLFYVNNNNIVIVGNTLSETFQPIVGKSIPEINVAFWSSISAAISIMSGNMAVYLEQSSDRPKRKDLLFLERLTKCECGFG